MHAPNLIACYLVQTDVVISLFLIWYRGADRFRLSLGFITSKTNHFGNGWSATHHSEQEEKEKCLHVVQQRVCFDWHSALEFISAPLIHAEGEFKASACALMNHLRQTH